MPRIKTGRPRGRPKKTPVLPPQPLVGRTRKGKPGPKPAPLPQMVEGVALGYLGAHLEGRAVYRAADGSVAAVWQLRYVPAARYLPYIPYGARGVCWPGRLAPLVEPGYYEASVHHNHRGELLSGHPPANLRYLGYAHAYRLDFAALHRAAGAEVTLYAPWGPPPAFFADPDNLPPWRARRLARLRAARGSRSPHGSAAAPTPNPSTPVVPDAPVGPGDPFNAD